MPNWQLVPDVRAKRLIPVSLMLVPIEKGMESAEAFRLLKEYLLKIRPDLWRELRSREASGITRVLPAPGKKADVERCSTGGAQRKSKGRKAVLKGLQGRRLRWTTGIGKGSLLTPGPLQYACSFNRGPPGGSRK